MTTITRQWYIDDEAANRLHMTQNDRQILLHLQLKSEGAKKRRLGVVTKSTKTMHIRRERAKHLFIKNNSYGFNDYVLRNQTTFNRIDLFDGLEYWDIPLEIILKNGKILNFKEEGFEKQIFMSLEQLAPYKIKPTENRRI